ncbi:MAG: class I SAM-dependent methyltransferase [Planctomycetes bacterium]|nr:class I SAM-dependent methyltransferase [Planctomycetota bacterium]
MSSWTTRLRRDLTGLLALVIAVTLVVTLGQSHSQVATSYNAAGPKVLLWLAQLLDGLLPRLPRRDGETISLVGLGLLLTACAGLFYCVWRLSRNRIVSLGAAFLLGAQPLARVALLAPAGLGDLLDMALLSWLLAVAAGPRHRSSRFPNRPPLPARPALVALFALGLVGSPAAMTLPVAVLLFDLFFQREPGRRPLERDWRAYAPHLIFFGFAGILDHLPRLLDLVAAPATLDLGPGGRLVAAFGLVDADSAWLVLLAVLLLLGALALGLLELLFDLGRRRLTLPWIGFAGGMLFLGWFFGPATSLHDQGCWRAALGPVLVLPVLAWRLVMRVLPVAPEAAPVWRPGWDDHLHGLDLRPLPDLAGLPVAPRLEDWTAPDQGMRLDWQPLPSPAASLAAASTYGPELRAALERIGHRAVGSGRPSAGLDPVIAEELVAPRLGSSRCALLLVPSTSPYPAFVAERVGELIVVEQLEGERPGFPELAGLDNLRLFEQDGRRPWPSRDASVDLILVAGAAEKLPVRLLQVVLGEGRRVLAPGGRLVLDYPIFERAAEDANVLPLATLEGFIELADLRQVRRLERADRQVFELAARGEG